MKRLFVITAIAFTLYSVQAQTRSISALDPTYWGVVLEHPGMNKVKLTKDVVYREHDKKKRHLDIYTMEEGQGTKKPVIIFLNGIGDREGQPTMKSWAIYQSWPRLMAAYGYVGVSMETDGNKVQDCFDDLFRFISKEGSKYGMDENRIGVYAASANTTQSGNYLMKATIHPGIKAAVLYYGNMPTVPLRKDLPVLFVVAEGDVRGNSYQHIWNEVLKNKAPWTIKMASGLPHGFDAFSDTDEARIVVKETISFWKNHLDPVVKPGWKKSVEREIVETQYWQNYPRLLEMMRQWKQNHAGASDPAADRLYANALMNTGNFDEAEKIYRGWVEQDTTGNPVLLRNLAIIYYGLRKKQEAEYLLKKLTDSNLEGRNQLMVTASRLYQLQLYADAGDVYEKANSMESIARDYYNAGCCFSLAGNSSKAFENLLKAAELGFNSKQQYEADKDLENIRNDHRWKDLLSKLK
jgi:tetratricopeptide (TPR) repeat protein